MANRPRPREAPAVGDIQLREPRPAAEAASRERRRRKSVDKQLAQGQPADERVDGLTGKFIG